MTNCDQDRRSAATSCGQPQRETLQLEHAASDSKSTARKSVKVQILRRPSHLRMGGVLDCDQVVTDLAEIHENHHGWIYFMGLPGPRGPLKIGWSKKLEQRLRDVQVGHPEPLEILFAFRGTASEENALHRFFAENRIRKDGEWFTRTNLMLAFWDELTAPEEEWDSGPFVPAIAVFKGREVWDGSAALRGEEGR